MRVTVLASTILHDVLDELEYIPHWQTEGDEFAASADELAEFAGRACYKSWERPNPKTATNHGYLGNILDQKHYSVLEHASVTFYIQGISRSLTHELVRHRHFSYSQESQRFVDSAKSKVIIPPAVQALPAGEREQAISDIESHMNRSILEYEMLVKTLEDHGASHKEAREAARVVMPNGTETSIVVTGNLRAWREYLTKRATPHADAEIRQLSELIFRNLRELAPNTFQDMDEEC